MGSIIFEKIKQSKTLPKLPRVILKLRKLFGTEDVSAEELMKIVSSDSFLLSRLNQIIKSYNFDLPDKDNSINALMAHKGVDSVRNLLVSVSCMHFFACFRIADGFDMEKFWKHSYKCGLVAESIALEKQFNNSFEFFLTGFLQNTGRLVMMHDSPGEFEDIFANSPDEGHKLFEKENVFNSESFQISAWMLRQWGFNPLMSDSVQYVNEPLEQIEGALEDVKIIYCANCFAGVGTGETDSFLSPLTGIPLERLEEINFLADNQVDEMAGILGIGAEAIENKAWEDSLAVQAKKNPFFYNTLNSLLQSDSVETALDITQSWFKDIFNVDRLLCFLLDEKENRLVGFCLENNKYSDLISSLGLPMSNGSSLIVRCAENRRVLNSLKNNGSKIQAISDMQIIRLFGSSGIYCIPIVSFDKACGVMVLGVDADTAEDLDENMELVSFFVRQTGLCIRNLHVLCCDIPETGRNTIKPNSAIIDKLVHEINNPVSIVKNYLETLSLKLPDKHPVQNELGIIGEEMNRIAGLLERLKSVSQPRIESFEPVDINLLCHNILDVLKKSLLLPKQIESSINADPEIPKINTDKNGLKQVLINLVKNAAEAMTEGGEIRITTQRKNKLYDAAKSDNKKDLEEIEIVVADNGPGIDAELMDNLFEPYSTTKKDRPNAGLGLSIVHSIIKDINGSIVCETNPGKGGCFVIRLPINSFVEGPE